MLGGDDVGECDWHVGGGGGGGERMGASAISMLGGGDGANVIGMLGGGGMGPVIGMLEATMGQVA